MRTTLDLDPVVMSVARAKAKADNISLGRAISELALAGLRVPPMTGTPSSRFPVLPGVAGFPVTDELVTEHRDD